MENYDAEMPANIHIDLPAIFVANIIVKINAMLPTLVIILVPIPVISNYTKCALLISLTLCGHVNVNASKYLPKLERTGLLTSQLDFT